MRKKKAELIPTISLEHGEGEVVGVYLPMNRMKRENKIHLEGAKVYGPQDYEVVDELKELKEENRKLKEEIEIQKKLNLGERMEYLRYIDELEEENKKLKDRIDELEKCNLNLQERLDNKEKVNKKLRDELSAYDREYFDEDKKAKNIYKSQKENILMGKI